MTRLNSYAEGEQPIGVAFDFDKVVDTAAECPRSGGFVYFCMEDAKVGICRFRLTASQAKAAAYALSVAAFASDGGEM
jgi:hypothetical protein